MKWIFLLPLFCVLSVISRAQTAFYNNGASITVSGGGTIRVAGNLSNQSGSFTNGGTLSVSGQTTNNGTMATAATSTLLLNGSSAQTLGGSGTITAKNVVVTNAAGVTLSSPLEVNGSLTLTSGLLTANDPSAPIIFTATGTVGNTPTDASHINGYVRKLGTGSFTFPVGSATKYQPVTVDLSANAAGVTVLYTAADAGNGSFSTAGTQPVALVSYDSKEHWDIQPVTTATGTVTLYWDGVNETAYPTAARRIAHKVGSSWQNEGGTATGTTSAGSITSNTVSSWSPFAMGSLSFPLPVRWTGFTGELTAGKATLHWQVTEENVSEYEIQKSADGRSFQPVSMVTGLGNGRHSYSFTEDAVLQGQAYYRIAQKDRDGGTGYSAVIFLKNNGATSAVKLSPNPAISNPVLSVPPYLVGTKVQLYNNAGSLVKQFEITSANQVVDISGLAKGSYILHMEGQQEIRLLKN